MKKFFLLLVLGTSLMFGLGSCKSGTEEGTDEIKIEKSYEERVAEIQNQIRTTPQWLAEVEKKAKEKNILLDSVILEDARWLVDEQDGKHQQNNAVAAAAAAEAQRNYDERLKAMEDRIRQDQKWMEQITAKAAERKISIDSMVRSDARWMLDEEDGKHK